MRDCGAIGPTKSLPRQRRGCRFKPRITRTPVLSHGSHGLHGSDPAPLAPRHPGLPAPVWRRRPFDGTTDCRTECQTCRKRRCQFVSCNRISSGSSRVSSVAKRLKSRAALAARRAAGAGARPRRCLPGPTSRPALAPFSETGPSRPGFSPRSSMIAATVDDVRRHECPCAGVRALLERGSSGRSEGRTDSVDGAPPAGGSKRIRAARRTEANDTRRVPRRPGTAP